MTATTRTATSTRFRKLAVTGVAALGAAAAALTIAPSPAHAAAPASHSVAAATVSAAGVTAQANSVAKAGQDSASGSLDGWIRQSLDVMKSNGIPGSYEGLHRNIMRESGGNPNAANGWDVNAQNGTPSKGLLQVIQPTFDAYHVSGTAHDLTDPIANITAAAKYAADKYGSIDNVNSAY